ncbi:MAG: biotin carboxylase [Hymenobacter sp.]|nr:MAG: biotin carboxylase [Hymenobacter sp.]
MPAPAPARRPLTVALTGLNATDSPGAGVAVARALAQSPDYEVRLIGLSYEALEPGIYLRDLFAKTYQLPYPAAGSAALLERLAELPLFGRLAPPLRALGIQVFVPTLPQLAARDKLNLGAFGAAHGLAVPATQALAHAGHLPAAAAALGYPLVLKGRWYEAHIVHNLAQAQTAFRALQARWGLPLLAQRFVAGQELNVAGLADGRGHCLSAVPMRKLTITDKGKAWAGITIVDEVLAELAHRFAQVSQWRGAFELELLRTPAGELFVLEINPRFPAWIYLAAAAGHNQPAALLRLGFGGRLW